MMLALYFIEVVCVDEPIASGEVYTESRHNARWHTAVTGA